MRLSAVVLGLALAGALRADAAVAGAAAKLLAADTEIVVSLNVQQFVQSATLTKPDALPRVVTAWKKLVKASEKITQPIEALGVELFTDITRITCAGKIGPPPIKIIEGMVIMEGTFKLAALKAAVREKESPFKVVTVNGTEVWEWASPAKPDEPVYVALLNPKMLLLTENKASVAAALDQAAGKTKDELDPSMAALLEKADAKETLTCVVTPTALFKVLKDAPVQVQVRVLFPGVRRLAGEGRALSGGITLGERLKIGVGMNTRSPEAALRLRRQANRLALIATLVLSSINVEEVRPWEDLVRSLRARADGAAVYLDGEVAPETLEKILKTAAP
jgi:hypothetical protein